MALIGLFMILGLLLLQGGFASDCSFEQPGEVSQRLEDDEVMLQRELLLTDIHRSKTVKKHTLLPSQRGQSSPVDLIVLDVPP